jgi:hypothetical protein
LRIGFLISPWVAFPRAPVFIPDGRISRVRLATLATVRDRAFPAAPKLERWPTYTPCATGLLHRSTSQRPQDLWVLSPSPRAASDVHQAPRAPSPSRGVTSRGVTSNATSKGITPSSSLIRAHAPDQNPPTDSSSPRRWVFAGCCQSLLGDGPSRRYLCIPCVGAWTHAPGCHLCARARSFQRCNGHRPRCKELGPSKYPAKQLQRGVQFSRLQSFTNVQAPTLARPPGCSHRRNLFLGGQAVYTAHNPVGYLPRVAASLHARHGQLAWLDSHQLEMQPCRLLPHPLDDKRSFRGASHPPFPFDQPCLVAP